MSEVPKRPAELIAEGQDVYHAFTVIPDETGLEIVREIGGKWRTGYLQLIPGTAVEGDGRRFEIVWLFAKGTGE